MEKQELQMNLHSPKLDASFNPQNKQVNNNAAPTPPPPSAPIT
jgi:hypothetical protein